MWFDKVSQIPFWRLSDLPMAQDTEEPIYIV